MPSGAIRIIRNRFLGERERIEMLCRIAMTCSSVSDHKARFRRSTSLARHALFPEIGPRRRSGWMFAALLLVSWGWSGVASGQDPGASDSQTGPASGKSANEVAAEEEAAAEAPAVENPPAGEAGGERYWTTQWSFEDVDVGQLATRLRAIGIDLGVRLRGNVTAKFEVGIPLTSLGDGAAYRFDGSLTSPSLRIEDFRVREFRSVLRYRGGVATLQTFRGEFPGPDGQNGRAEGTASLELVPRGNLSATLQLEDLSLRPIVDLVAQYRAGEQPLPLSGGSLSGQVELTAPIDALRTPAEYELTGTLAGEGLELTGLPPARFRVEQVSIRSGVLRLGSLRIEAPGSADLQPNIAIAADASLPLDGTGPFDFQVVGDDVPTATLVRLFQPDRSDQGMPIVAGKVDVQANGRGELRGMLQESEWQIDAKVASPRLALAGVNMGMLEHSIQLTPSRLKVQPLGEDAGKPGRMQVDRVVAEYTITEQAWELSELNALAFGGRLRGAARIPTDPAGDLTADLQFADLRPTFLRPTSGGSVGGSSAAAIAATLSGSADWRVPIEALGRPAAHQGKARIRLARIAIGGEEVGELALSVAADQGELALSGEGNLFGGSVQVDSVADARAGDAWSDLPARLRGTQIRFAGVDLRSGLRTGGLGDGELQGQLSGTVSLPDAVAEPTSLTEAGKAVSRRLAADFNLEASRLRYGRRFLSRRVRFRGRWLGGTLTVERLAGDYAGGTVRVRGDVRLAGSKRDDSIAADLGVSLSHVDLERAMWFLGDAAENYQGQVSGAGRLSIDGDDWRFRGNVDGREFRFFTVAVGEAHSGVTARGDLSAARWRLNFPSIDSSTAGGRLDGELVLASTHRGVRGIDLQSRWRVRRVDFVRLTKQLGRGTSAAQGRLTGDITLNGDSIRTVNDLAGRFQLRLGETRGSALPGLAGASRFLGPLSLATEQFDVGEAKGVVGNGAIRFEELWVGSDNALVRAEGRVFLRSGGLDMTALIATGDFADLSTSFAELARRYALQTVLPVSAIMSVSELIRDRALVVRVLGTTGNPIVRPKPVETFQEEAVRFLLREGQRLIIGSVSSGTFDEIDF